MDNFNKFLREQHERTVARHDTDTEQIDELHAFVRNITTPTRDPYRKHVDAEKAAQHIYKIHLRKAFHDERVIKYLTETFDVKHANLNAGTVSAFAHKLKKEVDALVKNLKIISDAAEKRARKYAEEHKDEGK